MNRFGLFGRDRQSLRAIRSIAIVTGVVAACALAWASALAVTGGFKLRLLGLHVASQDPVRPLIAGVFAAGVSLLASWRLGWLDFDAESGDRRDVWVRAGLATAICVVGMLAFGKGAFIAAGSDASGYISQSRLWRWGSTLRIEQPSAKDAPWPDTEWTFCPLGYRPATISGHMVPTYPAGLPILMALARMALGENGVYWVVPVLGALAVWLTFKLATAMAGQLEGLATAWLLVLSPTFLHQVTQPMSDVPAMALWLSAIASAWLSTGVPGAIGSGLATSVALLIRPNLVPLALPVAFVVAAAQPRWSDVRRRLAGYVCAVIPAILAIALLNRHLYGSPLASGYGSFTYLFGWGNVGPNSISYSRWIVESETPLLALGLLAPFVVGRHWRVEPENPKYLTVAVIGFAILNVALYLPYIQYAEWWYLRFVLPSLPLIYAAMVGAAGALAARVSRRARLVCVIVLACSLAIADVRAWTPLDVFGPGRVAPRYLQAAEYVSRSTPSGAVIVCMEHSGSIRYYSGRTIFRYDFIRPEWLDVAITRFQGEGRPVLFVLDEWEIDRFRERFARRSRFADLDWRPASVVRGPARVFVFAAADVGRR